MSRFRAQDGFLHFVFANRKDRYFLPSFVCLDLEEYLYYQLKKQGYEGVFFIDGLEGLYAITIRDEASRELYQKYYRKSKGFMGLFSGEKELGDHTLALPALEDRAARFGELLRKGRNMALVFRLDSFCELFGQDRPALDNLCAAGQKYLEQNGNILILLSPMTAVGSLSLLTDPQGIFAQSSLCPELRQLLQQSHSVRLYDQLAQDLGERCVFLNVFSYDNLLLLVRCGCLLERSDLWENDGQLQDLAAFLHSWYESAALREHMGPILPENDTRQYSLLLHELLSSTTWWRVQRAVSQLKAAAGDRPLKAYLQEEFPAQSAPLILADSLVARKIRQIRIPQGLYRSAPELGRGELAKFRELQRRFQSPRSKPLAPELEKHILQCLATLENALSLEDTATFERCVKALSNCAARHFIYDSSQKKIWNCQEMLLRLSEDVFRLDGLIREDNQKCSELAHRKKTLIQTISQEKARIPTSGNTVTAQEYALSVKMQEAVSLDHQEKNLKQAVALKQDRRLQSLNSLRNLELAVGNLSLGMVQDVEQVLHDAVTTMEKDVAYHLTQGEKLQSLNSSMDSIFRDIPQHPEDEVQARYEQMLTQLDTPEEQMPLIW